MPPPGRMTMACGLRGSMPRYPITRTEKTMGTIRSIRLPDIFYREDERGERTVVDREGAVEYVTDGQNFGIRLEAGSVEWLGTDPEDAFGPGAIVLESESEKRAR
jgi:hypothetical protein